MDKIELLIVVPAYNESKRINKEIFLDYLKENSNTVFLFVDDGSTDNTSSVLEELSKQNSSQLKYLILPKNFGKGNAIREGYLWAKTKYNFNYFGFIDSDLAIPLEVINDLHVNCHDYQLAIASRFKDRSKLVDASESSFFRNFLSLVVKKITHLMFNGVISDTQCGCKLLKKSALPVSFNQPFISSWLFDIEIFLRLKKDNSFLVYEHQLKKLNKNNDSQLRKRDLFKVFFKLNSILINYYIKKAK